jgi:energy-coupling factor transporter ATP-binding protein EcfA2
MIRLEHVTYAYPNSPTPVLADASLEIADGEFLVVAGPSGSGKSTLLRTLNGLVPHFYGGTISGRVDVLGHDPVAEGPGVMSAVVGLVFQSPEAQCVATTVEEEAAFAMENHGLDEATMRERVDAVLAELGIAHLRARQLETLSGGERQRVAIAAVLTLRPRVLVLDEPTSQIDPAGAEEVVQALVRLNRELGLTVILCEHRLERVVAHADRLLYVPGAGRPLLLGEPRTVLAEMEGVPPVVALGKVLEWSPLPLTVEEAQGSLAVAGGEKKHDRVAGPQGQAAEESVSTEPATCNLLANPAAGRSGPSAVHISGLSFSYNSSPALHEVQLDVGFGEIVALMGANGAGKTTLLKHMVGLLRPKEGTVETAGLDTQHAKLAQVVAHVGYVPQNPDVLLFADTVREELDFTLRARGRPAGALGNLPHLLGIEAYLERYPRDLSVGERQRVALAAVLVGDPRILLLDEPTRGLDYAQKEALEAFLRAQSDAGRAVVLATHDVELAARCADRVVLLERGRVLADGPTGEVMVRFPSFASQVSRLYGDPRCRTVEDVVGTAIEARSKLEMPRLEFGIQELRPQVRISKSELRNRSLAPWIIALASLTGLVAFLYPFFAGPAAAEGSGFLAHAADAPVVTLLCLVAILAGLEVRGLGSKQVALLGILAAMGALLRPIPGPYGFSLLFFLPILCGYAVGPTFGFLLGALTLLVSALVTGGVGPWLPYQMLSTGWVGMLAGFLPDLRRWRWGEVVVLAAFSLVLGLVFGAVMNLWFWPFMGYGADSSILWEPGLALRETLARYGRFYVLTSLIWDLGRGVGNVVLILVVGRPVLRLLRRFTVRFAFRRA